MRIQCPKNLMVPLQGSSMKGKLGPKIRPHGVVDGQFDSSITKQSTLSVV